MNPVERNGSPHPLFKSIRFDDFDVTWAGPNPFRPGFCFGSDDGRLRFTDEEGKIVGEQFPQLTSREAINGVALIDWCLAATTRTEVTLFQMNDGHAKSVSVGVVPVGAHGITATDSGLFVAPSGVAGLQILKPQPRSDEIVEARGMGMPGIQFYRTVALTNPAGGDLLVSAIRQGGIGVIPSLGIAEKQDMTTADLDHLDIVDVCVLDPASNNSAFAAAARDGTLFLFGDASLTNRPSTTRFKAVEGTVYRIASCRGHLFVLTSTALYMLADLAGRFLRGESDDGATTPILNVPMAGVDMNLCGDRHLLVVTADEVLRFDIDTIEQSTPADSVGEFPDADLPPIRFGVDRRSFLMETAELVEVA